MASVNARETNWDGKWATIPFGLINQVNPDLKLTLSPIKRGTTGKHVLGHFISALEGDVSVEIPAPSLTIIKAMTPWYSTGTQIFFVPPAMNVNLYTFAQPLVLHPHDVDAADLTQDLTLVKAAPMSAFNLTRDGDKEEIWKLMFFPYPDFDQLVASPPVVSYGYLGHP
jgi:hypothetical protein